MKKILFILSLVCLFGVSYAAEYSEHNENVTYNFEKAQKERAEKEEKEIEEISKKYNLPIKEVRKEYYKALESQFLENQKIRDEMEAEN